MILYRPTDGDVLTTGLDLMPKTCFLMTQLGDPVPAGVKKIRNKVTTQLKRKRINVVDADSITTGGDFLNKIWGIIVTVPMGVAIIHEDMTPKTIANVFYELGMMDALGKRTVVVKSTEAGVPSDFVRTEYINNDGNFARRFRSFLDHSLKMEDHFERMADDLEKNPLLSIDYLRRAFLLSGDARHRDNAADILDNTNLDGRAKNSVEMLLARF